ncbi:AMP-binding protein [Kitasatospora sp. NPDC051170]|uniref:AMP-binding protein n=1 Tax=Kitasatospora sp. NPDC051170 TaxID=3364056 RepID=UPI003792AE35
MSNLATNLTDAAGQYPGRPALRHGADTLTYADLDELSARAAGGLLAHGVRPGERVGLLLPDVPAFPVLYYGALRIGAVVVTAVPGRAAPGARLVFAAGRTGSGTGTGTGTGTGSDAPEQVQVPTGPDFLGQLAFWPRHFDVAPRADSDLALLHHGPAVTALTHGTLRVNAFTAATALLALSPEHTVTAALPLAVPGGQSCGLNAAVLAGACLTLPAASGPRQQHRRRPPTRRDAAAPTPADAKPGRRP